jgi:hypothetical protein
MIFEITWMNRMGQDDFGAWWNPYVYVKCHKNGSYVEVGGKLFLVQVNIPSYHLIFCFHHPNICWNFENHLGKVLQSGIIVLYVHFDNPTFMHLTCRKLFLCIPLIALILTYVFPRHCSNVWFTTSSFFDTSFLKIFNDFYPQQTSRQSLSKQLFFQCWFSSLRYGCHCWYTFVAVNICVSLI